ncbi:S8 family serine peptidase [Sulfitobacter sp. JB4-11]|uniref:S8 family serine peptidase n=1 Tax=Sulfitobacter rhodophyticola TaxID=3238304 RepID=UPI003D81AC74
MFHTVRSLRRLATLCLLMTLLSCAPLTDISPTPSADVVGPRKVIALVPDAQSVTQMRAAAQIEGYRELDVTRLQSLDLTMLTFRMTDGVTGPEAIAALEAAVPSSTVGINHAYRLQQQAASVATLDYAATMMNWRPGGCRALAPIGLIDTGIDTASPGLAGAQIRTRTFFEGQAAASRHGTDVASILIGPDRLRDARIFGANVFGQSDTNGPMAGADALVRALDWLAEEDVQFVNLALAGPYNKLLDLAVERAVARGLILVAAVGNEGPAVAPLYPAGFDRVIAVTAVDADGRLYSNAVRGPHVDVAAPGVDVLVASGGRARFVTGTSIATPFVTARLAADPSLARTRSVSTVRKRLAATSAELGPRGRDASFGYGLALAEGLCSD